MSNFVLNTNAFLKKKTGTQRSLDFPKCSILRYVGVFSVRLLMIGVYFLLFSFIFFRSIVVYLKLGSRLTCFDIFLYFLQKHHCIPKIGFSADISIDIFIDIPIEISIDISIDVLIGILIDISIDMVTGKEEGGGERMRRRMSGVFLKSNNPTPTGGETEQKSKKNYSLVACRPNTTTVIRKI